MIEIIDPRLIPSSDFPFFISKGGGLDLMSKLIRWRTGAWCEHSMLGIEPQHFVWESASSWYGEGGMEIYMVPNNCLKFYTLVNQTPDTIKALQTYVQHRIDAPWWAKMYDYVGILGEVVGLPKIHTPGLEYCSVDNIHALQAIAYTLPSKDRLLIASIPSEETPGYLDNVMANSKDVFNLYGTYNFTIKPVKL